MEYQTPPPTTRKRVSFKPYTKPIYYEDIYGTRNAHEHDEGPQDLCETESDSDDTGRTTHISSKHKFFGRTVTKVNKKGPKQRKRNDAKSKATAQHESTTAEYKIAPELDPRQSVLVSTPRRLTPKKLGVFAGYAPDSNEAHESTKRPLPPSPGLAEHYLMSGGLGMRQENGELADVEDHDDDGFEDLVRDTPSMRPRQQISQRQRANPTRRSKRIKAVSVPRPLGRTLLKQQLEDQEREKRAARRAGRAGTSQKTTRGGSAVADVGTAWSKDFASRSAVVLLEDEDVDTDAYVRY